jgi:excisionase family DNA binding protein
MRQFEEETGLGHTKVCALIAEGKLHAVKVGRRTLILGDEADRWLASLKPVVPGQVPSSERNSIQRQDDRPPVEAPPAPGSRTPPKGAPARRRYRSARAASTAA